jgi:hypothetical protein
MIIKKKTKLKSYKKIAREKICNKLIKDSRARTAILSKKDLKKKIWIKSKIKLLHQKYLMKF